MRTARVDGCAKKACCWVATECFEPSLCEEHGLEHGVVSNRIHKMPNSWFGAYVIRRSSAGKIVAAYQETGYDGNCHVDFYLSHALARGYNGLVGFAVDISNAITIHDSRAHERQTLDKHATTGL